MNEIPEKPLFHRILITLSWLLLIFHTLSVVVFLASDSTHAFVFSSYSIQFVGVLVSTLALFILPNVNSEKSGAVSYLTRGVLFFLLIWLAQILGSYLGTPHSLDLSPTVAIFSAGIILLPLYSLMVAAVSVIYLNKLSNRFERSGKLAPLLITQNVVIPVIMVLVPYSVLAGVFSPSETFAISITSVVIPILFVFGLETVREEVIEVLGAKVGGAYFSLLSVVYISSLGTVILFDMGSSSYDAVIHETMVDNSMLFGGFGYERQMNGIRLFSVIAGLMTIIGTVSPLLLKFIWADESQKRSINFLTLSATVAIFYLIGAAIVVGMISGSDENVAMVPVGESGGRGIFLFSNDDSAEVFVCSDYELQNRIVPIDSSSFGIPISTGYDIEFEEMQASQITGVNFEFLTYSHCTNIVISNITEPTGALSAPQILLTVQESTERDSFIAIIHSEGEFIDIGSYSAISEEGDMIHVGSCLGLICSIPVILLVLWIRHPEKPSDLISGQRDMQPPL